MNRAELISKLSLVLRVGVLGGVLLACQGEDKRSSQISFDWENNLRPIAVDPYVAPPEKEEMDKKFCANSRPGSCFSLILRVPTAELIADIGLSTLAIANKSRNMRLRLEEACSAAFQEYRYQYMFDILHPLRSSFVRNIEKARCVFIFMTEEYVVEDTALADNEIAFSSRLTKFDIIGENAGIDVHSVSLQMKSTKVETHFRNAFVYGGKDVSKMATGWQHAKGFASAPVVSRMDIERNINWKFDITALVDSLSKMSVDSVDADAAVSSFISQAKYLATNAAKGVTPINSSLVLVGMGYNAFRSLCGEASDKCKTYKTTTNANSSIGDDFADFVPTSETNEMFRVAMIKMVQGVLDRFFTLTHAQQLKDTFNIR